MVHGDFVIIAEIYLSGACKTVHGSRRRKGKLYQSGGGEAVKKVVKFPCKTDSKLQEIQDVYGLKGFAIATKLIQKIVENGGKYEWNDDAISSFDESGLMYVNKNLVNQVVCHCARIGLFVPGLYKKNRVLVLDKSSSIGKLNGGL